MIHVPGVDTKIKTFQFSPIDSTQGDLKYAWVKFERGSNIGWGKGVSVIAGNYHLMRKEVKGRN